MPCALVPSYLKHSSVLAMVIIIIYYVIFSPRRVHGSVHIDDSIPCFIINFVMLLQYFHMSASISIFWYKSCW